MPQQLVLDIQLNQHYDFSNFITGSNQTLLASLTSTIDSFIYLWGPKGVGKSHLLQAQCRLARENKKSCVYLPLKHRQAYTPEILDGLENLHWVCLDDVDEVFGEADWEEALFHLYNRIQGLNTKLVMSASDVPQASNVQLPDLSSRLTAATIFQILPLSDDDKHEALQLHAEQLGLQLPKEVSEYLLKHCSRNMSDLFQLLKKIDKAQWTDHRRLTVPFIKTIVF